MKISLSTTEAEYIALSQASQAMREVISSVSLLKELMFVFELYLTEGQVHWRVFEESMIVIAIACSLLEPSTLKHQFHDLH